MPDVVRTRKEEEEEENSPFFTRCMEEQTGYNSLQRIFIDGLLTQ